ncbi:hypothetical protein CDL12_07442 [Handroanthus impetiginosus]|uniref:Uncharacterized protein n=1 Tax=Handroanthus impetiginosus TaxID=429701 RepID=A0A2G9HQQ7_9LAMI|nr:hypothetical protein CDL12_07442 [Handroanthus impetiginosus]
MIFTQSKIKVSKHKIDSVKYSNLGIHSYNYHAKYDNKTATHFLKEKFYLHRTPTRFIPLSPKVQIKHFPFKNLFKDLLLLLSYSFFLKALNAELSLESTT